MGVWPGRVGVWPGLVGCVLWVSWQLFPPILSQQSRESVTLDLLTCTDLESLRNCKVGGCPGPLASRSAQLNSKCYLILIYSVEFDRYDEGLTLGFRW